MKKEITKVLGILCYSAAMFILSKVVGFEIVVITGIAVLLGSIIKLKNKN